MGRYFLVTRTEWELPQSTATTMRRGWISISRDAVHGTRKAGTILHVLSFGVTTGLPYDNDVLKDFLMRGALVELSEEEANEYAKDRRDLRQAGTILGLGTPIGLLIVCFVVARWLGVAFTFPVSLIVLSAAAALAGAWIACERPSALFNRVAREHALPATESAE